MVSADETGQSVLKLVSVLLFKVLKRPFTMFTLPSARWLLCFSPPLKMLDGAALPFPGTVIARVSPYFCLKLQRGSGCSPDLADHQGYSH